MLPDFFFQWIQETSKGYNLEAEVVIGKEANLGAVRKPFEKEKVALHQSLALGGSRSGKSRVLQCSAKRKMH